MDTVLLGCIFTLEICAGSSPTTKKLKMKDEVARAAGIPISRFPPASAMMCTCLGIGPSGKTSSSGSVLDNGCPKLWVATDSTKLVSFGIKIFQRTRVSGSTSWNAWGLFAHIDWRKMETGLSFATSIANICSRLSPRTKQLRRSDGVSGAADLGVSGGCNHVRK